MTLRKWILLAVLCSMLVGCGDRWSSGDRVLVSKCNYDTGLQSPHRYDVVVFKYPGRHAGEGPMERNTPKNYIKRLLGLPGELIAILFGRIYRWAPQPGEEPPYKDLKDGVKDTELHDKHYLHIDDELARKWFDEGKFEIQRKPAHVLMAMRRIVFDNDYQAKDLKGRFDRWSPSPGSDWKSDKETGFVHEGKSTERVDWVHYQHLLRLQAQGPPVCGKPSLIVDTMDYNSFQTTDSNPERRRIINDRTPGSPHWVGDLMLECNIEVQDAKGEFWLELSKGTNRFQARFDLSSGQCALFKRTKTGKTEELGAQPTRVKGSGSYLVRFANIDACLTVWVDRDLPFRDGHFDGKVYDPPEMGHLKKDGSVESRGPDPDNDLQPASIGSKGGKVKITHLRLWRDTYYTTAASGSDYGQGSPVFNDPTTWESIRKARYTTLYVQPGHYLCLGDNSQASSDSRDWGLVPERLMLGRALMVYFPLERIGPIR